MTTDPESRAEAREDESQTTPKRLTSLDALEEVLSKMSDAERWESITLHSFRTVREVLSKMSEAERWEGITLHSRTVRCAPFENTLLGASLKMPFKIGMPGLRPNSKEAQEEEEEIEP